MSKRPVQRKRPVWKVFWQGLGGSNLISADVGDSASSTIELITANEVLEMDDEIVVKRIIGEIYYYWVGLDETPEVGFPLGFMQAYMGILVEDEQYDNTTMLPGNSLDAQDAPWAWLRSVVGIGDDESTSTQGGNVDLPATSGASLVSAHVDIKVARKLKGGDALKLKMEARATSTTSASWQFITVVNLRILVES